eukprot:TRINITY_DN566_c0_g1_i1.p3 TRINITY_DN566_c0_g1~~TRINITY_DN566_c0_g1_i1.p3  ORF type:complete len:429 (-),score=47.19 TRINITY_DN566_c0_g1_i1:7687-8973(-)
MIKTVEPATPEPMEADNNDKEGSEEDKEERIDWTAEQDSHLRTLVNTHGPHNWVLIAEHMNVQFPDKHKSSKQCRERWCNKLDPVINHAPWTKQEEAMLILSHMKYKNRWCDIVGTLKGRHNNMIKNRFYSIFRKVKNKIKNNDFSYTSKLELIEMYYMISVMEDYAANPPPPEEPKRKRGKDFMYTLIEDLDITQLTKYKIMLNKKYPIKVPLNRLLGEILHPSVHTPEKPVSQINMAFSEPMEDHLSKSATPGTCPARSNFLTLPQPKSFFSKEPLTPDEKDFVIKHAFTFGSAKTDHQSPAHPFQPSVSPQKLPPFPVQNMPQPPPFHNPNPRRPEGYYSTGTGGVNANFHVIKGGFGDFSSAHGGMHYQSVAPTLSPSVMVPGNHSFFYMSQMQQASMPQMMSLKPQDARPPHPMQLNNYILLM